MSRCRLRSSVHGPLEHFALGRKSDRRGEANRISDEGDMVTLRVNYRFRLVPRPCRSSLLIFRQTWPRHCPGLFISNSGRSERISHQVVLGEIADWVAR